MTHFLQKRDPWGNRFAVWVVVLMVFALPLGWWSLKQIRLENDVEKWLPENDPELLVLNWLQTRFPTDERVFVTWNDCSLNDLRIEKFVAKLEGQLDSDGIRRGGLPHITRAVEPRQLLNLMQKNGVEPHEAVRRLEGVMIGAGSLKLRLTEFGKARMKRSKSELAAAAKSKFGIQLVFSDPVPDFATLVSIPAPTVPDGEVQPDPAPPTVMSVDGTLVENQTVEHDLQVSWFGIHPASRTTIEVADWMKSFVPEKGEGQTIVESCFFAPGAPVAIALTISESGLADKVETVDVIRQAATAVGIPAESLRMGGSTIAATELNNQVMKAAWDKSHPIQHLHKRSVVLTSALVVAVLSYLLVRSIRLATLVLGVSLYTTFMATSLVPITGGSMNMVIVLMPSLLMFLTMSGAIHVANYWKHAACRNPETAISDTIQTSRIPCFLASLTTSIGLISLCTSRLTPVRDFGVYAAIGTMFSLVMVLYGLPSLLQLWPGRSPQEHELDHPGWRFLGQCLTRWPVVQSLVFLSICVACSYGLTGFRAETKVIRFFPEQARIADDYRFIETQLAGIMPVETVVRFDAESQKETTFIDRLEAVRTIQEQMRSHPEITGTLSLADFLPVSDPPDANAGLLTRSKYTKRANQLQQRIRDGEFLAAKTHYTVAEEARDLVSKGDHRLNEAGDELWRITAQVAVMTDNDFGSILNDINHKTQDVLKLIPGSMHRVTGTVPLFLKTQQAVVQSLLSSFGLAFVLILGVFVVTLKNFWAGLVAMVPNILPITVVFGSLSWAGQRVDIGTMITASIALGIAVDGTLHFLTWVQGNLKRGQTRRVAIIDALVHCGPAMWQTSLALALGLLVLVPAELVLISRFGGLMMAMIGVALLTEVVFMPQLLAGPLGLLFEPAQPRKTETQPKLRAATETAEMSPIGEPAQAETSEAPETASPPAPHFKSLDADTERPASKSAH